MANVLGELFGDIANAIREKTGDTATMKPAEFPDKIAAIETGGGSSDDVRYVTFMSYDGTVEYGKKAVAVGDDCADPIARGIFDTPTRESDVQYNYTFAGWATEANGGLDSDALKAVTEDKTVYANYISALRYYTITYYDSDGTTVLKTESLAYGSTPSYIPTKEGYSFEGWNPAVAAVTGDTSYTAVWAEKVTFAGGSWADIAEISEAGEAADYFKVGDSRIITLTDGQQLTAKIAGFNHDTISGSSNTAGISIICETAPTQTVASFEYVRSGVGATITDLIPEAIKGVVKSVDKSIDAGKSSSSGVTQKAMSFWIPSIQELGRTYADVTSDSKYCNALGSAYELYLNSTESGLKRYVSDGTVAMYYLRNYQLVGTGACYYHNGTDLVSATSGSRHVIFGFCI